MLEIQSHTESQISQPARRVKVELSIVRFSGSIVGGEVVEEIHAWQSGHEIGVVCVLDVVLLILGLVGVLLIIEDERIVGVG